MRWNIDAGHSGIGFGVRHLGISTVKGRFREFGGAVETDAAGAPVSLDVTIQVAGLDTNVADRDRHLRSADFFDAERFPEITFRSTGVEPLGDGRYGIDGNLVMRGVSRPVRFDAEIGPQIVDPWGNRRVAGEAVGKLNRRDWGLTWNQLLETGALVVGEDVKFHLEVEVVAAAAQAAA